MRHARATPPGTPPDDTRPRVAIVLCSYRGERHLGTQLDSIAGQSWPFSLHVHDDASDDGTVALARAHAAVDRVVAHAGNVGYVANFERGIAEALADGFDYVALSDQDDVWEADRLARGMRLMLETERRAGAAVPVLVHSDLAVIDEHGALVHPSYLACRGYALDDEPDLALVLGQNGVMGNTCLFNRALAELALPFPPGLHVHDWWLALLGELHGRRRFEPDATVRYRLHATNASNPAGSVEPGALAVLGRLSLARLLARDFRLPFKEDTRAIVLRELLDGDARRGPREREARRLIERFVDYLTLARPRASLFVTLLRHGFLRRGLRHRARVALALLTSARYGSG